MTRKRRNDIQEEGADLASSFFNHLLKEAGLTRSDICQIFREYENERILVPWCFGKDLRSKCYSAEMWAVKTLKNIVLDAYDNSRDIVYQIEQFARFMEHCAVQYPPGEVNTIFSTCYDVANDILGYFLPPSIRRENEW